MSRKVPTPLIPPPTTSTFAWGRRLRLCTAARSSTGFGAGGWAGESLGPKTTPLGLCVARAPSDAPPFSSNVWSNGKWSQAQCTNVQIGVPVDPSRHADALRAAQMYYLQDLTMDAIARELRTSRSTVSRLLSSARDTGLVQVQIRNPLDTAPELEGLIRRRFGVDVHVVPVVETLNEAETLDRVAMQAARTIGPLVDSNAIIGVAWGSTLSAVSRQLTRKITHDSVIVQLNGAGNMHTTGITYASDIMRRFGSAYGARVEQFPVPAFFDHAATKTAMWNERSVQRILALQAKMSIAIFGVGSVDADYPSHVYAGGYLDENDLNILANSDVVGDVATVFFRSDGSSDGIVLNERSTGPALSELRQVRRRICVVSGVSKINGLKGALAAGLATDLILDEATARRLVGLEGMAASNR